MKVYLVRHGETDCNSKGLVNGRYDEVINENGRNQATEVGDVLKNIKFDAVFSSPLKRAIQTAEIITKGESKIVIDDLLIERDAGANTLKPVNDLSRTIWWDINVLKHYEGSENVSDVIKRVEKFINKLKSKPYKNVLIVTHSGIIRVMMAYFEGIPEDRNLVRFSIKNCEIKEYELN